MRAAAAAPPGDRSAAAAIIAPAGDRGVRPPRSWPVPGYVAIWPSIQAQASAA